MERILCAAIHYQNDKHLVHGPWPWPTGWTLCGWRHNQIIELYHSMTGEATRMPYAVQGFLTSENQFVTRAEAAKIALAAGQIKEPVRELLSEHLY